MVPTTQEHEGEYEDALRPPERIGLEEAVRARTGELSGGAEINADDLALARRVAEFMSGILVCFLRQSPALSTYFKMCRAAIDITNALPGCAIEGAGAREKVAVLVERACNSGVVIPNAKGMLEWGGRRYGPASGDAFITKAVAELATVAGLYPHEARTSPEPKVPERRQLPSLRDSEPFADFVAGKHGEYWLDWTYESRRYMAKVMVTAKGITTKLGGDLRGQGLDITKAVPLRRVSGWLFNVLRALARAKHGGVPKPLQ
jgi:hypothetical protein